MRLFRLGIRQSISAEIVVDLVDFPDGQPVRQRIQVVLDFSRQHIPVHHLHFRRADEHFLQLTAFTEDDVGAEHFTAQPKMILQVANMFLILPDGIVKSVLFPAFKRLGPVTAVFVAENPPAVILRLEYIDAGFGYHDKVDFSGCAVSFRQIDIR